MPENDEKPVNVAATKNESRGVSVVRPKRRAASTSRAEDTELIEACRRGEERAMEALYHQYKRRVFGLVTRIVGPSDSEEVAQEVFVRIFRGLAKFRGDAALGTWIYRLSVNAALTHVTRRNRHPEVGEEVLANVPAPSRPQRDPCLSDRLTEAMSALPPGYRAILVLHDVEGLSHEECAAIMGCRVGTSKSQLHKARMRMRDLLGPELAAERATRRRK
jgi:RNA polymerase sigma-70 factor (ECF subfamily)